jgi:hypothetical protein
MKSEIMKNELSSVGTQRLRLPLQTAPVERTLSASSLLGQDGVVPSNGWANVAQGVLQALPAIFSLF